MAHEGERRHLPSAEADDEEEEQEVFWFILTST